MGRLEEVSMPSQRDVRTCQKESDRAPSRRPELGIATLWLALYVLLIGGATISNLRGSRVSEIADTMLDRLLMVVETHTGQSDQAGTIQ
jgi:hypothetical protein